MLFVLKPPYVFVQHSIEKPDSECAGKVLSSSRKAQFLEVTGRANTDTEHDEHASPLVTHLNERFVEIEQHEDELAQHIPEQRQLQRCGSRGEESENGKPFGVVVPHYFGNFYVSEVRFDCLVLCLIYIVPCQVLLVF